MCIFKIYLFLPLSLALKDGGCNAFFEGNDCEKGTYNSGFLVFSDFIQKVDIQYLEFLLLSECNFGNCSVNEAVYMYDLCCSNRDTEHASITINS